MSFFLFLSLSGFSQQTNINSSNNPSNTNNKPFLQDYYEQDKPTNDKNKNISTPNPLWTAVKIILYIGVFGVAAYFLIRFLVSKGALPATADEKIIETILTKSIGMGSFLQIVKVGTSYYLLSLSSEGARLIDKITDQETIDYIELNKESMKPKQTKFIDILTFFPKSKSLDKMGFLKNQKDRLKKL